MRQDSSTHRSFLTFRTKYDKVFSFRLPSIVEDVLEIPSRHHLVDCALQCVANLWNICLERDPSTMQSQVLCKVHYHLKSSETAKKQLVELYDATAQAGELFEAVYIYNHQSCSSHFVAASHSFVAYIMPDAATGLRLFA